MSNDRNSKFKWKSSRQKRHAAIRERNGDNLVSAVKGLMALVMEWNYTVHFIRSQLFAKNV